MRNYKRDYDIHPIVIKDYNYIFGPIFGFLLLLILLYVTINSTSTGAGAVGTVCAISAGAYMKPLFSAYDARKIVLSNSSIKFLQYDRIIEEIKIDELTDIRKTYSVLYHKSQHPNDIQKILLPIFFFPSLLIWHLPIIILKFFFHFFKKGSKYRLFDAIIVFDGDKFINILPATEHEYQEVRKYFMLKKPVFDAENAKVYWYAFANEYEKIKYKDTR